MWGQGINVVIVALQDKLLDDLHSKLKAQYPQLEFRAVGVDLSGALLFSLPLGHANNFVASLSSLGYFWAPQALPGTTCRPLLRPPTTLTSACSSTTPATSSSEYDRVYSFM